MKKMKNIIINTTAKFVCETSTKDPDTGNIVHISIYKASNGAVFALDSSWLDQCAMTKDEIMGDSGESDSVIIPNPFDELPKYWLELLD